jgi:hypothetical protein
MQTENATYPTEWNAPLRSPLCVDSSSRDGPGGSAEMHY